MILYKNINKLDLHGYDRISAKLLINEFIDDNHKLKNKQVIIVHGVGTGILKNTTHKVLKSNKYVRGYKLDNFNIGVTIVDIKI